MKLRSTAPLAVALLMAGRAAGIAAVSPAARQHAEELKIRPGDVVMLLVVDQPDFSKKYPVEPDGTVMLPLVGAVEAAGKTAAQLAGEVERRLSEFLRAPRVQVKVERTKRIFVFGGVSSPGMYQLTEQMTLVEVLARAGYGGASEVVIVRNRGAAPPASPDGNSATEVIRVNLREFEKDLESGRLSRNVVLEDGDTIYVPRFDPNRIYVSGEVRNPGAYSVPEGTTVLQAMTLAGGPTENAALGRIRVFRLVDGKHRSFDVKLDDVVRPGDTIVVPRRRF